MKFKEAIKEQRKVCDLHFIPKGSFMSKQSSVPQR
jgi:hypothetical protein